MMYLSWNCACARCLSGDCCAFPKWGLFTTTTITTTSKAAKSAKRCLPTEHDFQSVVLGGGTVRLFCRRCGITRGIA